MGGTKYAKAVAAIKAMENYFLTHNDIEQLINASGKSEMDSVLASKKGNGNETDSLENVWATLMDYAPECKELKILLYKNDFHNLKAALKSMIAGREPDSYYIKPSNIELSELKDILSSKEYERLPEYMRNTAEEAYKLITKTLDGQLADSLIDCDALKAMQKAAEKTKSSFMIKYALLNTVCADIKTAYRCCKMKNSMSFMETAICGSSELEKDSLVRAAMGGMETLTSYLENSSYGDAARLLEKSTAQFEKWCDDVITELAEQARMQSFGFEPLAAYYIAAEAEIKNLRILSICKEFGADRETVTERMRKLYV